jgi:hypothetical protein
LFESNVSAFLSSQLQRARQDELELLLQQFSVCFSCVQKRMPDTVAAKKVAKFCQNCFILDSTSNNNHLFE